MTSITTHLPTRVRQHLVALRALLVLTVLVGVGYPLAVTGVAQVVFPHQANGSLVHADGRVKGSSLLGQAFADGHGHPLPQWFQPRPSASDYDPMVSGATNLGPDNPQLVQAVDARRLAVARFDGVDPVSVPADALTSSGSGLDPDISPAYAREQANRVARARGLDPAAVHRLVDDHIDGRVLGFLGEPRVNVLELNLALARLAER
jgi:K+-transporting ATPase ATPase C chain